MVSEMNEHGPRWWAVPGDVDVYAYIALGIFFLAILFIIYLYALFDKFAEHKSKSTPLKTTIPTLLVIALAYEILPPLSHFSALLPLALIATALARDLMLWFSPDRADIEHDAVTEPSAPAAAEKDVRHD